RVFRCWRFFRLSLWQACLSQHSWRDAFLRSPPSWIATIGMPIPKLNSEAGARSVTSATEANSATLLGKRLGTLAIASLRSFERDFQKCLSARMQAQPKKNGDINIMAHRV